MGSRVRSVTSGDIRLSFDAQDGYGDIIMGDRDLERDEGLETAVLISLFTDRRAEQDDELPDRDGSKQGWWADDLGDGTDRIGSKLWLLARAKPVARDLLPRAEQYCKDALQWMIADGVASEVAAEALLVDKQYLQITIAITRPQISQPLFYRWMYNWRTQSLRSN